MLAPLCSQKGNEVLAIARFASTLRAPTVLAIALVANLRPVLQAEVILLAPFCWLTGEVDQAIYVLASLLAPLLC